MTEDEQAPPGVDPTVLSPARMYDYYLGGTHNYQADRDAAEKVRAVLPELGELAWANRGFHQRAARWIAGQGIRQFIDIGSGLPTTGNTHEVVQKTHPRARVVYVDNDPIVHAYADELLAGNPTAILIQADLRDPDSILGNGELRELIDFTEPAGLLMTFVMHFVSDAADPSGLVRRYMNALAPGSYLALSHITHDQKPPRTIQTGVDVYSRASENVYPRSLAEVERFFDGLEIVPPYQGAPAAVAHAGLWDCDDPEAAEDDSSTWTYCAVARRP